MAKEFDQVEEIFKTLKLGTRDIIQVIKREQEARLKRLDKIFSIFFLLCFAGLAAYYASIYGSRTPNQHIFLKNTWLPNPYFYSMPALAAALIT